MKKFWQRVWSIDSNSIIAVSAVIISLCALLVSLQEVRIMREQQKATMFPFITVSRHYSDKGFKVIARNSGTGLARINSVEVTNGTDYYTGWLDIVEAYLPDSLVFGYDLLRTNTINELMITPNESVELFSVLWSPATRLLEERTRNLDIVVCYSSLLNDHWKLQEGVQQEIAEPCDRIEERQFY